MPYNCCVPQCNSTTKKNKDLMFHTFPKVKSRQREWLVAIKSAKVPSVHAKVCSKHFTEDCYTVTSMGKLYDAKFI